LLKSISIREHFVLNNRLIDIDKKQKAVWQVFKKNKIKKEIRTTAEIGITSHDTAFSSMSEEQKISFRAKSQAWELFLKEQQDQNNMEMDMSPLGTAVSKNSETIPRETGVPVDMPYGSDASPEEVVAEISPDLQPPNREPAAPDKSLPKRKMELPALKSNHSGADGGKGQSSTEKNKRLLLLCIIIFAVIVAGSAFFIHWRLAADRAAIDAIVEQRMAELSAANTASLEDINTRISTIEGQMTEIVDILEITDKSIASSSSANREAMAKQIQELDKQMSKLKESINLLLESKAK